MTRPDRPHRPHRPMRIELDAERRDRLVGAVKRFVGERFDRELSDFQADQLIDFFVAELGPPVYNQAIRDARGYLQEKLDDLDGEYYEPEEPFSG